MIKVKPSLPLARIFALSLVGVIPAFAAEIAITNADFEDPNLGAPPTSPAHETVTGWTEETGNREFINNSSPRWTPTGATKMGYFTNRAGAAVNQNLGHTWTISDQYTMTLHMFEPGFNGRIGSVGGNASDAAVVQLCQTEGTVLWTSGTINLDDTLT